MTLRTHRFVPSLVAPATALLLLVLLFGVSGALSTTHAQTALPAYTLRRVAGTVTNEGGTPLGGVRVDFYSEYYSELSPDRQVPWYRDSLRTVTTGSDGRYSTPLAPGIYQVRFSDPAGVHAQQYYRNARTVDAADDVVVMGNDIDGISAQLAAGGSIRGAVVGPQVGSGSLAGMSVAAYTEVAAAWQVVQEVSLMDSNSYVFLGLPRGVYRLCLVVTLGPRDGPLPCYADRGGGPSSATDVPLAAGATVQNIDIALGGFTDLATLRGTVTDKGGAPLPGIDVQAFTARETITTATDATGAYTLSVLAPQETFLAFTNPRGFYVTQWYSRTESGNAALPIATQPSQVYTGLDAVLELGGRITGTVTLAGNTAAGPAFDVAAFRAGQSYPFARSYASHYNPRTGEYVISGLPPGVYNVCERRWAPWGQAVYSCYPDRADITAATPITVAALDTVPDVNFTVAAPPAPGGHVLTGTVRSAAGDDAAQPLGGMQVSLHLLSDSMLYRPFAPLATTTSGDDGTYRFEGLGGGSYRLRVLDPQGVYATTYYSDSSLPEEATSIFVGTDATPRSYDVSLAPAGALSGRVQRADGTGLPYALLRVYQVVTTLPFYRELPDAFYADDEGRYRVGGLHAGRYVVCAQATRPPLYGLACHGTQTQYVPDGPSYRFSSFLVEARRNTDGIDIVLGPTELTPIFLPQVSYGGSAATLGGAHSQAMGRITGVVRSGGGDPLAGIYVDIYQASAPQGWIGPRYALQTDAAGRYWAEAVEPGSFRVHFYDPRQVYAQQFYSAALAFDAAETITVNGNAVDGIDATLAAGGGITGSIAGGSDTELADHPVGIFREVEEKWELVATAEDAFGAGPYGAFGLAPGVYRVCWYMRSGPNLATGPCYDRTGGGVEWATDVTVTAGAITSGIDLVARGLVDAGSIRGTVRSASGAPLRGIRATVYVARWGSGWGELRTVTTDGGGRYHFDDLAPDDYAIAFYDPAGAYVSRLYGGILSLAPLRAVTISRGEQREGIDVTLRAGSMIRGAVLIDGSLPPVRPHIAAVDIANGRFFTATYDRQTGDYQVGGLPSGTYVVGARNSIPPNAPFGFDAYYGGSDFVSATRLTIAESTRLEGIDIVLLPNGFRGVVTGTVTGDGGRGLAGMRVELFTARQDWWETPRFLYTATAADGSYELTGLPDGEYYVRVVDPDAVYSPGYSGGGLFAHQAARVVVAGGLSGTGETIQLVRSGAARGRVFDQQGAPAPGADVYFFTDDTVVAQVRTDSEGAFAAGPFPPGRYGVCAFLARTEEFGRGCYGEKPGDPFSAARVEIVPGATVAGIDIFFDGIPGMTDRLYLPGLARTAAPE